MCQSRPRMTLNYCEITLQTNILNDIKVEHSGSAAEPLYAAITSLSTLRYSNVQNCIKLMITPQALKVFSCSRWLKVQLLHNRCAPSDMTLNYHWSIIADWRNILKLTGAVHRWPAPYCYSDSSDLLPICTKLLIWLQQIFDDLSNVVKYAFSWCWMRYDDNKHREKTNWKAGICELWQ